MKKIPLLIFVFVNSICFSQEKIDYLNFDSIVSNYRKYSETKEFDKLLNVLDRVSTNDSLYIPLLVTKTHTLIQLERYQDAIKLTEEGLKSPNLNDRVSFYQNKLIAQWRLKEHQNALNTIKEALKEFPMNDDLYYNKGLIYYDLGNYELALNAFKFVLFLNPNRAEVHVKIGDICFKNHLTTQALMCYNLYLLLNPDGNNSFKVLNSVNNLFSNKNTNEKKEDFVISEDDEAFEEMDLILNSRITLSSDYKIDNEINIGFVKQNHALFQKLNTIYGSGGFWDSRYLKLHKWISDNNYFDDFIYTMTYSIENPDLKKIVDRKVDNITSFLTLFKDQWPKIMENNDMIFNNKKQNVSNYFEDGIFQGLGTKLNGVFNGYWEFFNEDGKLKSKGYFDESGDKTGEWIWYHTNGKIKEIANYLKGNLEGENIGYFENGNLNYKVFYSNDKLSGNYKLYSEYGGLIQNKYFNNGELSGKFNSYYTVGEVAKEFEIMYNNGDPEGLVLQYYPSGLKQFEIEYKNGVREGIEKNFYANEELDSENQHINGVLNGIYKSYYKNGTLFEEGQRLDGLNTGNWNVYYPSGTLKNKYTFNKGELVDSYLEYSPAGKLFSDFTYRNNELIAYKFFNEKGDIIKEARKKGGEFLFEGYTPEGNKTSEGLYNIKGGKEGDWKFYSNNGVLISNGFYNNNLAQGEYKTYHNNGIIESISNYKNDSLSGYYVSYFDNDKMKSQGWHENGLAQKKWKNYYKNGTLKSENFYHNGNLHGKQINYAVDGQIFSQENYKFGRLLSEADYDSNGKVLNEINFSETGNEKSIILHHSNKNIKSQTSYKNGLKHGAYFEFDVNGYKRVEGNFINGEASGKWIWYRSDGKISSETTFVQGLFHNKYIRYYENGNIEDSYVYILGDRFGQSISYAEDGKTITRLTNYLNDKSHGKKIFYDDEGRLQIIRFYEFDKLIGYSYLNKEGDEIPMIEINNETGKFVSYYNNGNISRAFEIKNGKFINEYKVYYYNGNIKNEHSNNNAGYHGKKIDYYKNGELKEEVIYVDNDKNGLEIKYFENGKTKEEINYVNDEKSGVAKYYNNVGKLIKVDNYFNGFINKSTTY